MFKVFLITLVFYSSAWSQEEFEEELLSKPIDSVQSLDEVDLFVDTQKNGVYKLKNLDLVKTDNTPILKKQLSLKEINRLSRNKVIKVKIFAGTLIEDMATGEIFQNAENGYFHVYAGNDYLKTTYILDKELTPRYRVKSDETISIENIVEADPKPVLFEENLGDRKERVDTFKINYGVFAQINYSKPSYLSSFEDGNDVYYSNLPIIGANIHLNFNSVVRVSPWLYLSSAQIDGRDFNYSEDKLLYGVDLAYRFSDKFWASIGTGQSYEHKVSQSGTTNERSYSTRIFRAGATYELFQTSFDVTVDTQVWYLREWSNTNNDESILNDSLVLGFGVFL